jgi:arylsulfatase A-like enzyme
VALSAGALLLLFGFAALCASPDRASVGPKPNVVFILADDLGYSDTTLYGNTWLYETPNIQKLAERGMLFTNAYSASPLCSATRASILTGQDPGRIGLTGAGAHLEREVMAPFFRSEEERAKRPRTRLKKAMVPVSATRLPHETQTLAEVLSREGYATGHVGKWHLGHEPYTPLEHGFESDVPHWPGPGPPGSYLAPWQFPAELAFESATENEHIEDRMVDEAIAFMTAHRDKPFLLNYWAFSVHAPFDAKPQLVAKYAERVHPANAQRSPVYAAMVETFDAAVGKLVAAIEDLGIADRTIIVFFSDNGGSTYDFIQGVPATSNAPLRGGKAHIYEGGSRVPAAVVWPGHIEANSKSGALLSSSDWFPTLLALLGVDRESTQPLDGVSQLSVLQGGAAQRESMSVFLPHYFPIPGTVPASSIRKGNYKLIRFHFDGPAQRDRLELYDLGRDPGEQDNLATSEPERASAMNADLALYLDNIGALLPKKNNRYAPAPVSE